MPKQGYKHSEESRKKISMSKTGKPAAWLLSFKKESICKKISYAKKNISDETRKKLSIALTGKKHSKKSIQKMRDAKLGKKASIETREKMKTAARRGEKNNMWKGGVTTENEKARKSIEYKEWRNSVLKRDNWTCQFCGSRGVLLHADHIKPFAYFRGLRFDIENGRTLCVPCHKTTPTYGEKAKSYIIEQVYG